MIDINGGQVVAATRGGFYFRRSLFGGLQCGLKCFT
jgi:hypothetical protein